MSAAHSNVEMATLPPRKHSVTIKVQAERRTPLQLLLQMGFPRHRAEKALTATGHKSVQLASDWLLAHVNDPTIDLVTMREYILYAVPVGQLMEQLQSFWEVSANECGWNGAHNFFPHISLTSFFKAPNEHTERLVAILKHIMEDNSIKLGGQVKLENYMSPNFMGLFVEDEHIEDFNRITMNFVDQVSNLAVPVKPHIKALHLTIAYQFPSSQFHELKSIVESSVDPNATASWEIRLYSRDSRFSGKHVYKVNYSHIPREPDELELRTGDFVYLAPEDVENSPDSWVEGTSWLTGCCGFLPVNYVERTAETDAWTLHASFSISSDHSIDEIENLSSPKSLFFQKKSDVHEEDFGSNSDIPALYENLKVEKAENRQLYIVRHGERVDFTFGKWIPYCFDERGSYMRKDLNLPLSVPQRASGPPGFLFDSPLTQVGELQARLTGEALRLAGRKVSSVYCSPSLRCVQTCHNILLGLGIANDLPIAIEPSLFEWLGWYTEMLPEWLCPEELVNFGFNIDVYYEPSIKIEDLKNIVTETVENYYNRSYELVKKAISQTGGNILFVGHASSLETCTRQLIGKEPLDNPSFLRNIQKVSYCSLAAIEETDGGWEVCEPPIAPITHSNNHRFDWKILMAERKA
ncbi:unnamed protein product [Bemisia tabaci]|uniref:Ecdysteroid-phosphate phosphatase n=1 Tax=Bemisia tabaci TaxID=7038 RepID=A0A9P0F1G8_BEMTA|nr:unnamed protein product [Bemisia tabaci]